MSATAKPAALGRSNSAAAGDHEAKGLKVIRREAESAWTRLRRRKVIQWGLIYVAAAWGSCRASST